MRRVPFALVAVTATVAAGCGGSSSGDGMPATATTTRTAPRFSPAAVEKMIRRSIQPTLAANVGAGATLRVSCAKKNATELTCDSVIVPGDGTDRIRVIYGVTCDATTCRWEPIG